MSSTLDSISLSVLLLQMHKIIELTLISGISGKEQLETKLISYQNQPRSLPSIISAPGHH